MNLWQDNFSPMLLCEVDKPFIDKDYLFEIKFDGIRALIFIDNDIKIKSRYGLDITNLFPELKIIKNITNKKVILDGEIIIFDNDKVSFSKLQQRIHLKNKKTIEYLSKTNPVVFIAFDILYENKSLLDYKLIKRKEMLDKYEDNKAMIKSKYILKNGVNLFKKIKKLDMEGIVAKRLDSKYLINERSTNWIKIKNYKSGQFYVLGYTNNEKSPVISIALGSKSGNNYTYVGNVVLAKKYDLAKNIIGEKKIKPYVKINKAITYIKPIYQVHIKYLEKTPNNHLRHPFMD